MACKNCRLVKTIIPENLDLGLIYNESYFQGGQLDGYADYIGSEKVIKKEFKKILRKLIDLTEPGSDNHLLEIGYAYGFFLDLAKEYFKCSGIEISAHAAEDTKKRYENVICGTPDAETLKKLGTFNIVVMLDVIEHLPNPSETLRNIANLLPKKGIVLLTTGNIDSLYPRIAGKHWRLMTPPQHVTFFSPKSIFRLFERNGLKIIKINTPVKTVSIGLALYQLFRRSKIKFPESLIKFLNKAHFPVNLFDTMCVIAVKT